MKSTITENHLNWLHGPQPCQTQWNLWTMPWRATQDRWVMVENSDKTWSTGERHGKSLQYSCLENHMNSMTRQKDITTNKQLHMKFLLKSNCTRDVSNWSDLVPLAKQPYRAAFFGETDTIICLLLLCQVSELNVFSPPDPQHSRTHELFSLSDELLTAP